MRLLTWNAQWCRGIDGVISAERLIETARAMGDFDVLCLQEISQNYPGLTIGSPDDQPAEFTRLLPDFEVVFGPAIDERPAGRSARQRFGNLIASRLPIRQVQHLALPSPVGAGASHPWMPRQCTACTIEAPWGPVRIMTTHLEYYSETHRVAQTRSLRTWHQALCDQARDRPVVAPDQCDTPYQPKPYTADVVLCGDFNSEPHSAPYDELTSAGVDHPFRDSWELRHPGRAHPPTFRLFDDTFGPDPVSVDFCFVSESLAPRVVEIAVDTATQASDHQPVMIELVDVVA